MDLQRNGKPTSENSSASSELLQRMTSALQNSHKAIQKLQETNRKLIEENTNLRQKIKQQESSSRIEASSGLKSSASSKLVDTEANKISKKRSASLISPKPSKLEKEEENVVVKRSLSTRFNPVESKAPFHIPMLQTFPHLVNNQNDEKISNEEIETEAYPDFMDDSLPISNFYEQENSNDSLNKESCQTTLISSPILSSRFNLTENGWKQLPDKAFLNIQREKERINLALDILSEENFNQVGKFLSDFDPYLVAKLMFQHIKCLIMKLSPLPCHEWWLGNTLPSPSEEYYALMRVFCSCLIGVAMNSKYGYNWFVEMLRKIINDMIMKVRQRGDDSCNSVHIGDNYMYSSEKFNGFLVSYKNKASDQIEDDNNSICSYRSENREPVPDKIYSADMSDEEDKFQDETEEKAISGRDNIEDDSLFKEPVSQEKLSETRRQELYNKIFGSSDSDDDDSDLSDLLELIDESTESLPDNPEVSETKDGSTSMPLANPISVMDSIDFFFMQLILAVTSISQQKKLAVELIQSLVSLGNCSLAPGFLLAIEKSKQTLSLDFISDHLKSAYVAWSSDCDLSIKTISATLPEEKVNRFGNVVIQRIEAVKRLLVLTTDSSCSLFPVASSGLWHAMLEDSAAPTDNRLFKLIGLSPVTERLRVFVGQLRDRSLSYFNTNFSEFLRLSISDIDDKLYGRSVTTEIQIELSGSRAELAATNSIPESRHIEAFEAYWRESVLSNNTMVQLLSSLQDFSTRLLPIITCYYDELYSGWRVNDSGDGVTLNTYLTNEIEKGTRYANEIATQLSDHSTVKFASSIRGQLRGESFLPWIHYNTAKDYTLLEAAGLLDFCRESIFEADEVTGLDSAELQEEKKPLLAKLKKLKEVCHKIKGLVAFSFLERVLYAICCSLRGFLRFFVSSVDRVESHDLFVKVATESALILLRLPFPLGCAHRLDIHGELSVAVSRLCAVTSTSPSGGIPLGREGSKVLDIWRPLSQTKYLLLPCFVINLDRRHDRWRAFLTRSKVSAIAPIRIAAVDARTLENDLYDSTHQREDHHYLGKSSLTIPQSDVVSHWNSALNANFDRRYKAQPSIPMTTSERACAASHLKIWRIIATLYQQRCKDPAINATSSSSKDLKGVSIEGSEDVCRVASELWSGGLCQDRENHDDDWYLIFEDDAYIKRTRKFREELSTIIEKAPKGWDIIYLGGVIPRNTKQFKQQFFKGLFIKVNYIWMLHAYVIRGRTAVSLLANLPINGPVDNFVAGLAFDQALNVYLLKDELVKQHSGKSSHHDSDIRHSGTNSLSRQYNDR